MSDTCPTCGEKASYPMQPSGKRGADLVCWECGRYVARCDVEKCRPLKPIRKPMRSAGSLAPLDAWVVIDPPKRKRKVAK